MNAKEELKVRLAALPDVYPDFVRLSLFTIESCGLVDEVLQMLEETPDATTDTVTEFEWVYCGLADRYGDDGERLPVDSKRLALTSGMRDILADVKGKTLKSYQLATAYSDRTRADCNVRLNLGQNAVDLNCYDFTFCIGGKPVDFGAMHCERMSLRDDFGIDPDTPVHVYAVGERVTGVELVTDHAKAEIDGESCEFDIDVAVVLRTAHAVYTFSRESWRSTDICISVADDIAIPYEPGECDAGWMELSAEDGVSVVKVKRSTAKLA